MNSYGLLSEIYDQWQDTNNSSVWADYTEKLISIHGTKKSGDGVNQSLLLLDLGCGTGSFAIEMAKRGYDVLGIDLSFDMLAIAKEKENADKVQFILQDITNMKLYGTVDVMVCYLDTINHVLDEKKLERFFRLCQNYLNPDGLLIFDLATKYYFENIIGNQFFYDIKEQYTLLWENKLNKTKNLSVSELTFFIEQLDGSYIRGEETIKEKIYTEAFIENLIKNSNLTLLKKYDELNLKKASDVSKRIFYVATNKDDKWKNDLSKVSFDMRGKKKMKMKRDFYG